MDPTAVIKVAGKDGKLYILNEFYETELTNSELIERLKDFMKKEWVYADSAEPDRIMEFRKAGYKIYPVKKGPGSIKHGIDFIRSKEIIIHPQCVNFIREIQMYKYKEDKNGNVYDDPVDLYNHTMDSLRYATESIRKQTTKKPGAKPITKSMLGI